MLSLKNDEWIYQQCQGDRPLITPFVPGQIRDGVISYGLGGHGYDIRVLLCSGPVDWIF
jgi:dCTP deaminase